MDRASRNLLVLGSVTLILGAYGVCGFVAYGILPLLDGRGRGDTPGLLAVTGLGVLLALVTFRGCRSIWRQTLATRELSRRIEPAALAPPAHLSAAARRAGLADRVTLLRSSDPCSFVYGARAPRVVISSGLLSKLSADELRAALEHERYHVRNLDPLRDAIAAAAVDAMFFLPVLRSLRGRYMEARELTADRRAMVIVGPGPLAGALLKAAEGTAAGETAIPLAAPRLIEVRLAQLETGREPRLTPIDRRSLASTALGAFAFLVLLATTPLAIGGAVELSNELRPTSLLEGAVVCVLPPAAVAVLTHRRLTARIP